MTRTMLAGLCVAMIPLAASADKVLVGGPIAFDERSVCSAFNAGDKDADVVVRVRYADDPPETSTGSSTATCRPLAPDFYCTAVRLTSDPANATCLVTIESGSKKSIRARLSSTTSGGVPLESVEVD